MIDNGLLDDYVSFNDLVINYVNDIFAKKDLTDGYTYNKMEPSLINKVSLDIKAGIIFSMRLN